VENTLLVPIDFSEQSLIALEQACSLSKTSRSTVTILNVVKTNSNYWTVFTESEQRELEKKIEQKVKATAREFEAKFDVEIGSIIRKGKVVDEIMNIADYLKPKLIIMGTTPGNNISRKIIGSRALHIIQSSKYPVISIKGKQHSVGCNNILLPIDATKTTEEKVILAVSLANDYQAKVTIVTAVPNKYAYKTELIEKTINRIKNTIEDNGIVCDTKILFTGNDKDKMALSIIGHAHQCQADLIAIMTKRESSFTEFFLGSLAKNVIFSSDVPVLTINPTNKKNI
jgi:nucleotide-binding universal stress UspA family protein